MNLSKTLYLWAKSKENGLSTLEEWLDEAITAIAEGKGKEVVSTSGNGLAVSFAQGMTTIQWVNTLSQAIQYYNLGKIPSSTAIGRIV